MDSRNQLDANALSAEKRALLALLLEEEGLTNSQTQPITPRENPDELVPLSFAQQRMWLLNQMAPDSAAYNEFTALRITGTLDVAALEQSLNELLRRHEILRTVFPTVDGDPMQVSQAPARLRLAMADLPVGAEQEPEAQLHQLATAEIQAQFDLAEGPLLRAKLLRLDEAEYVFLLTLHHIISDGWSMGIFFKELAVLYHDFSTGQASSLPEPALQYADFAYWQRQWLHDEGLESDLTYWKQQLGGNLEPLELPTDHPRPPVQTSHGARHYISLPLSMCHALKRLSHQEGATLFITLLAAFQTLLHRYTGCDDIIVGSPIAGRNWPEVEGLLGCFLNTLAIRTDVSGNPAFRELLGRVRKVILEAFAHQDLPFEHLVEELQLKRELSRNPLYQAMFVLQSPLDLAIPGVSVQLLEIDREAAQMDLSLSLEETAQGLSGWWEYNTDLFDATTIARMAAHFQLLLEGIAADSEQRLSDLPLLTAAERQQLLVDWNATATAYPQDACVHELFEVQVERTPNAIAVVYEDERLTYRELNVRANQLAHHLQVLGIGPDALIGLYMERSTAMVIGILGILKAGGAYVPLDPAYPPERLAFMWEDARSPVLLTQKRLAETFPAHQAQVLCLETDWDALTGAQDENPVSGVTAENLAYVIYTSGSTGQPKGVMIPHRAIANHMFWMQERFSLSLEDRVVQKTPFGFDASVWEFFAPLLVGGQLIVARPGGHLDSAYLTQLMAQQQVTILQLVPSLLQLLLEEPGLETCTHLRLVFCGGEALSADLPERLQARLKAEVHNLYGPTEATIDASSWRYDAADAKRFVPIGRPIANTQIYLLDQRRQPVPIGVPGELHIGGAGLARGYLNRDELTAEKFILDAFCETAGARLYKTGDLARYLPGGAIEYLGRLDYQVKLRGFRIELGEIEAVLSQHPDLQETVVLVREDTPGNKHLVAYVIGNHEWQPEPHELREYLKEKLPDYMIPAAFVFLDVLPLLKNGKVDRRALPAPDLSRPEPEATFVAARDGLEYQIAKIWEKTLGIQPIGVQDHFFDLGGHSLLAMRLLAQIEKISGQKLPLVTLFQAPTVEQQASLLRQDAWVAPWASLVAIQPAGSRPPFFCVHAAIGNVLFYNDLARYLGPDQPLYGLQSRGLDGSEEPCTRVEEMAEHYIKEMQTIQPEGPYFFGGLSLGGTVIFEIAQQLRAQGQEVALLLMFDTHGPGYPQLSYLRAMRQTAAHLGRRIHHNIMKFKQLRSHDKGAFALEKVRNVTARSQRKNEKRLDRVREKIEWVMYKLHRSMGRPLPPTLRYLYVREINLKAERRYVAKPYPGRITLFRATQQPLGCASDPYLGWDKVVSGGVDIYDIPGSHSQHLIREPKIQVIIDKVQACLSAAQATASEKQS